MGIIVNKYVRISNDIARVDVTIKGDKEIRVELEGWISCPEYLFDDMYCICLLPNLDGIKVYSNKKEFHNNCKELDIDSIDPHYHESSHGIFVVGKVIGINSVNEEVHIGDSKEKSIWPFDIVTRKFIGVNSGTMTIKSMGIKFIVPFTSNDITKPIKKGSIIVGEFYGILMYDFKRIKMRKLYNRIMGLIFLIYESIEDLILKLKLKARHW